MSDLEDFRRAKDEFFRTHRQSPLTQGQRSSFTGLSYFVENAGLRFVVSPQIETAPERITIELSSGESTVYERWARVSLPIEGQKVSLTVFRDATSRDWFLPFRDSTSFTGETYGAGRYLDPQELGDGRLLIDFNYAYNPYCAYNQNWSCPLTPPENILPIAIAAGEKAFGEPH